ncbi:hypothetical protein M422DRAFT_71763 [Sphaerobolus stellatus SS14]|uniref:Xylanolytic transcriptional activator regulatory domain-containing protein n=1 Tax=Sphaerobolus stellatus (strain SS14) TaxID=990650 RepID=A0A0C9UND3_SPHS4|nr:hypothetical protein M422DRAFT_71763 [Sphaerobolus stellatus SS14]
MGIGMAFDLGLNRRSDEWASERNYLIPEKNLKLRRALWYGYVFMDAFISAQFGRLPRIRREDYDDGLFMEVDTQEDVQLWMPHKPLASSQNYIPSPSRITNCFRSLSSLAEYTAVVLQRLYPVRPGKAYTRNTEALEMDQKLQRWYIELPEALRVRSTMVAPPQILCLHMHYWCTALLIHRSLLPPRGMPDDRNSQFELQRALDLGSTAATSLANLANTFQATFGMRHAPPMLPYYLMIAGSTHVAVLQIHPEDIQAKIGLARCLDCLLEIKAIWPAASVFCELLNGTRVVKTLPPLVQHTGSTKHAHVASAGPSRPIDPSEDAGPSSSKNSAGLLRASPFAMLTYSLGLDPNTINSVFVPTYDSWPTNGTLSFDNMQNDPMQQALASLNHDRRLPQSFSHHQLGHTASAPEHSSSSQ